MCVTRPKELCKMKPLEIKNTPAAVPVVAIILNRCKVELILHESNKSGFKK